MIIALVLKATAILLVGLAASRAARRCRASLRHAILVVTFAALAVLPVAAVILPTITLKVPIAQIQNSEAAGDAPAEAGALRSRSEAGTSPLESLPAGPGFSPGISGPTVLLSLWLLGATAMLATLAFDIWRVQRLRRTAMPSMEIQPLLTRLARDGGVRQRVDFLLHDGIAAPMTCGVRRAAVIAPPDACDWSEAALHRALVHEIEHIRRRDWLTQIGARALCAVYWFHPLAWISYRQLCLCAEHACDDAVLRKEDGVSYADQLLVLARRMSARSNVAVLGMAQRSDLSARVHAVLDTSRPRGRAGLVRGALIATAAAAALVLVAPLSVITAATITAPANAAPQRRPLGDYLKKELVEAADKGDIDTVRELLDHGADVNASVDGDGSPLIAAAREGHLDLVTLLLDRGADPNHAVLGDGAPLIMAAREGHVEIVQRLLDRGARIDMPVAGDENALIQASGEGHIDVVKLLVARGADVNFRVVVTEPFDARLNDKDGRPREYTVTRRQLRTPLLQAERGGHREVAEFLRGAGAVE